MFRWILLFFIAAIFSCTTVKKNVDEYSNFNQNDSMELIRGFIYGLWSLDSENNLYNDGFYFRPDGTVDFVASQATAKWELNQRDTINIDYTTFRQDLHLHYKIDSLSNDRMILSDSGGRYHYRRVPFGVNTEGNVLQGYAGNLNPGEEREYSVNLPATKKIEFKLSGSDSTITFRIYDSNNEISSASLRSWSGIIIRSGKYRAVVSRRKDGKGEGEFDLKVIVY